VDDEIRALLARVPELRNRPADVTKLSGGLTNRNFRVQIGGHAYVLRVGSAESIALGIDRRSEAACCRAAAAGGIGAEVIAAFPEAGALVTRFVPGEPLKAEDARDPAILSSIVALVGRCHALAPPSEAAASCPFTLIETYYRQARERGASLPAALEPALARLGQLRTALSGGRPPRLCHNDLLPANFICDGGRIHLIDWEYAGLGDPLFDLGNLAANFQFDETQERALLRLYFGTASPTDMRRLQQMRQVSELREALWAYLQVSLSRLDFDYLGYAQLHLDRFLAASEGM
jgi:thiamine kinase-like enzyme